MVLCGWRTALRHNVEPVLFITFLTMNLEISLVQQLIRTKVCWKEFSDRINCSTMAINDTKVKDDLTLTASTYITAYDATLSLLTLIVGMWFGSWADKYGRKKLMVIPSIGSIISTLNFISISYFVDKGSPWNMLVSSVVIGLTTGTLGTCATCFGLISDTTSTRSRSTRMAFLEASMFIGGSVGFYLVGFMKPKTGFLAVFCLELVFHLLNILYIVFVIREPERTRPNDVSTTNMFSIQHVISMLRTVSRPRENNYRLVIGLLLCSSLMLSYGLAATSYLTFSFLHKNPLSFDSSQYSYYHGGLVAVQGISIVLVMPVCLTYFGMKDTTAGFIGALSRCLGLFWMSASTNAWMVYTTLAVLSFSEFAVPSIRSLVSKIVGSNEKAQVFACMSALQSFAFFTGSFIFVGLFKTTSEHLYPGFGFTLAGCLQLVPVVVLAYLYFALDFQSLQTPFEAEGEYPRYESTEDTAQET